MKNSKLKVDAYKMGYYQDNLCTNCHQNKIEDLLHYFFQCPKYNIQRNSLLQKIKSLAKLKNMSYKSILQIVICNNADNIIQKNEFIYLLKSIKKYTTQTQRFE